MRPRRIIGRASPMHDASACRTKEPEDYDGLRPNSKGREGGSGLAGHGTNKRVILTKPIGC